MLLQVHVLRPKESFHGKPHQNNKRHSRPSHVGTSFQSPSVGTSTPPPTRSGDALDYEITHSFVQVVADSQKLHSVCDDIRLRFKKLYPDENTLVVEKFMNSDYFDLDPDYVVKDVFAPKDVIYIVAAHMVVSRGNKRKLSSEVGTARNSNNKKKRRSSIWMDRTAGDNVVENEDAIDVNGDEEVVLAPPSGENYSFNDPDKPPSPVQPPLSGGLSKIDLRPPSTSSAHDSPIKKGSKATISRKNIQASSTPAKSTNSATQPSSSNNASSSSASKYNELMARAALQMASSPVPADRSSERTSRRAARRNNAKQGPNGVKSTPINNATGTSQSNSLVNGAKKAVIIPPPVNAQQPKTTVSTVTTPNGKKAAKSKDHKNTAGKQSGSSASSSEDSSSEDSSDESSDEAVEESKALGKRQKEEAANKLIREQVEKEQKEKAEKKKNEELEKKKKNEEEVKKREEEAKKKREEEAKKRREEEAKKTKEEEDSRKAEAEAKEEKRKQLEEEQAKKELEAAAKKEEEEAARKEKYRLASEKRKATIARKKAEELERAKAEEAARKKELEAEEQLQREAARREAEQNAASSRGNQDESMREAHEVPEQDPEDPTNDNVAMKESNLADAISSSSDGESSSSSEDDSDFERDSSPGPTKRLRAVASPSGNNSRDQSNSEAEFKSPLRSPSEVRAQQTQPLSALPLTSRGRKMSSSSNDKNTAPAFSSTQPNNKQSSSHDAEEVQVPMSQPTVSTSANGNKHFPASENFKLEMLSTIATQEFNVRDKPSSQPAKKAASEALPEAQQESEDSSQSDSDSDSSESSSDGEKEKSDDDSQIPMSKRAGRTGRSPRAKKSNSGFFSLLRGTTGKIMGR